MLEFSSRLSRLFTYSKDTLVIAQENFTTEALAIAVQDEPRPLINALCRLNPTEAARVGLLNTRQRLDPSTQVSLPGTGRLDLVLDVFSEYGRMLGAVWVEVKIDAPESGEQLAAYQNCAKSMGRQIWLLTLAHAPLSSSVANLTWHQLYSSARHGQATHQSWADLLAFLEDQMIANDSLGPISDIEAAAIEPAYRLAQKVTAVVKAVHKELAAIFGEPLGPQLIWKEGSLLNFVGATFRQSGELWGGSKSIRYGLTGRDGTAYWTVAVMPDGKSKAVVDEARRRAEQLSGQWEKPVSGPSILLTRTRATALDSHEAALEWFRTRLTELASAHVLDALEGLGAGTVTHLREPESSAPGGGIT